MNHRRIRTCIETEFSASGRKSQGQIRNLSEGGLFVGTAAVLEEGETVELDFRGPDGVQVRVSGMVWWTTRGQGLVSKRKRGFGMRLLDHCENFSRLMDSL